jgi:2-keto-3-deoxy-6-phosphogluconate aldolase
MVFKSVIFNIAKKCKVNRHPEWCGCLRPDEILALMESGCVTIDKFHEVYVERAKTNKAKGICNPVWFYFYPKKSFLEMV